jgi:hypothetical protein
MEGAIMTGLQEAFYIVGLVYMGLSLLLLLGVVIVIAIIRAKIVSLEKMIKDKIDFASSLPARAGDMIETVRNLTKHKGK